MSVKTSQLTFSVMVACSLGTILEWYDFSLYAYLAPSISAMFFPSQDSFTALILVYSIFAIGFLARPFGAILFGHIGDKFGRKTSLTFSMLLIAITTCAIGFLPAYQSIGKAAPLLLVFLRICQGVAIGGEVAGASSLVFESSVTHKQGFLTSIIWSSSGIGMLLSSAMVALLTILLTADQVTAWGWRIPFMFGAGTGVVGYYLRKKIPESFQFISLQKNRSLAHFPLIELIKKFKRPMLIAIGLYTLSAITTYLVFVFMPVFASKNLNLAWNQVMLVNTVGMASSIILVPVFGHYSDRINKRKLLIAGACAFLILTIPLYKLIVESGIWGLLIAQLIFACLSGVFNGPLTGAVLSMFPAYVRYSASAFTYNLSYSLFGGTAPLIATYFINQCGNNMAPGFYLLVGALISLIAAVAMRDSWNLTHDI